MKHFSLQSAVVLATLSSMATGLPVGVPGVGSGPNAQLATIPSGFPPPPTSDPTGGVPRAHTGAGAPPQKRHEESLPLPLENRGSANPDVLQRRAVGTPYALPLDATTPPPASGGPQYPAALPPPAGPRVFLDPWGPWTPENMANV
ncbi:hypothetical protein B0H11DRAFT_1922702 [Mycena galericulata]|nr:hypothetical protein B0H11DRAFT_1922702 [Mycena galericulata]